MRSISRTFPLDASGIDAAAKELAGFFAAHRVEKRAVLRARLGMEELLLSVAEHEGAPKECTLTLGTWLGGVFAEVRYDGAAIDPTTAEDEWSAQLLANLRLTPMWSWRGGVNTLRLRVQRTSGRADLLHLLLAVAGAVALGLLGGILPASFTSGVSELLLLPVFNAFIGLISAFAGPLILFTVTSGVFGIGDARLLQKAGGVMFSRYTLNTFACSLAATLLAARLFPLAAAPSGGESQLAGISQMFFDVLPSNLIAPFLEGNMMQIIVLALFLGVVLLTLRERVGTVARFVEEGSWVLQAMMGQLCRLIPLFVFVSLLRMIWSGGGAQFLGLWKPILLYLALLVCAAAAALVTTALRVKAPVGLLLRKVTPQLVIAFTTASSMAAYETSVENSEKKMGVDKHFAAVGSAIGSVVFMPSSALALALFSIYLAQFYGVAADLSWYVQACLLATVLAIAAPPTAGAALTVNTIMLAQLGVPAEGLLMVAAASTVLDFFDTAGNVAMRDLELVKQAGILGLLDRDRLRQA